MGSASKKLNNLLTDLSSGGSTIMKGDLTSYNTLNGIMRLIPQGQRKAMTDAFTVTGKDGKKLNVFAAGGSDQSFFQKIEKNKVVFKEPQSEMKLLFNDAFTHGFSKILNSPEIFSDLNTTQKKRLNRLLSALKGKTKRGDDAAGDVAGSVGGDVAGSVGGDVARRAGGDMDFAQMSATLAKRDKDITDFIEKNPGNLAAKADWDKKSNTLMKWVALAGGGYIYLSERGQQPVEDCKDKCVKGENDEFAGAGISPPEKGEIGGPGANCNIPDNISACEKFCSSKDGACSRKQRLERSQNNVLAHPFSSAADGFRGLFDDFATFWHYGKYFIIGIAILFSLFLLYQFMQAFAVGKAARYSMSGLVRGVGNDTAALKSKYESAQSFRQTVNP